MTRDAEMDGDALASALKDASRSFGADLVGIAPVERFDGVKQQEDPREIFPEARAVVIAGRRITRGTLRGIEEGTNWNLYQCFGQKFLEDEFVTLTLFNTVAWLEDLGWEAVPVFPHPTEAHPQGVPVAEGKAAPNVVPDVNYAAVAAGLGELGLSGEFLSPEYGPRQRMAMIITDVPLVGDPMTDQQVCLKCETCLKHCPLGAFTGKFETVSVAGRGFPVAVFDRAKCRKCPNGAAPNRFHYKGRPDRLGAVCTRSCMVALERGGRLSNKFQNDFRKRDAWALDVYGGPADAKAANDTARGCGSAATFAILRSGSAT